MKFFSIDPDQLVVLTHMIIAMFLGGLIGWERERSGKPAGRRTHMLVAGSASLLVGLAHVGIIVFEERIGRPIAGDPIRVIQTIITGFSFIGAGTIISGDQRMVVGLTTAGSVLLVATIGISVALSQIVIAVGATAIGLIALRMLHKVEPPTD